MKRLQGMWKSVPDLAFWSTIMYAFSFSAFFLQKAHVKGWIRSRVIMSIVQHTLQSILLGFTGIIVVLDSHDGWPFSQRIAQCGLSAVLFMKMHSYLIANRDLEEFYLGLKKDPDALFATYRAHEFKQALQERGIEPCSEDRTKLQRQFVEEIAKVKYDAVTKNSNRYPDNVTLWNFFIYSYVHFCPAAVDMVHALWCHTLPIPQFKSDSGVRASVPANGSHSNQLLD